MHPHLSEAKRKNARGIVGRGKHRDLAVAESLLEYGFSMSMPSLSLKAHFCVQVRGIATSLPCERLVKVNGGFLVVAG